MAMVTTANANRVQAAIERARAKIEALGGEENGVGLNGTPIRSLHETSVTDPGDWVAYQNTSRRGRMPLA